MTHYLLFVSALAILMKLGLGQQGLNDCGKTPSGSTAELGKYYYTCNDGNMVPAGCLSESKERIPIGSTFPRGLYQMKCVLLPDGHINVEYAACLFQGKTIAPGGTYEADTYWLSCDKEGSFIVEHISGCVYKSKRYNKKQKVRENETLLECRDQAKTPKMDEVGCVYNGKEYLVGESITDDKVWYTCTMDKGKVARKAIGCVHQGKTLFDGQTYYDGEIIFQCRVSEKDTKGAQGVPYGCIVKQGGVDTLKSFHCRYTGGTPPNRYLLECQKKGDVSVSVPVNCVYEHGSNDYYIEPGCFQLFGMQGVGCKNGTNGQLEYVNFQSTRMDEASKHGLKLC